LRTGVAIEPVNDMELYRSHDHPDEGLETQLIEMLLGVTPASSHSSSGTSSGAKLASNQSLPILDPEEAAHIKSRPKHGEPPASNSKTERLQGLSPPLKQTVTTSFVTPSSNKITEGEACAGPLTWGVCASQI
jgi:hypothetical protein